MAQELSILDQNVPAHIANRFGGATVNNDLSAGVSMGFPILSYKGKVWHIVTGDTRTLIADENGDPRQSLEVVLVKANPHISKVYYEGGYEEGSVAKPTCYSHDGVVPAMDSEQISPKCAICPHNQWGSKITENGAKGKACADSRRMAVAPSGQLDNPMLLRVPAGSLKELVAYSNLLSQRNTPYQAVVTKISFDHTVAHQKLQFKALRWLTQEQLDKVAEVMEGDVVEAIVGLNHEGVGDAVTAAVADVIEGERPNAAALAKVAPVVEERSQVRQAVKATTGEVADIVDPVIEPKPAVVASGFGGPEPQAEVQQAEPKRATILDEADDELAKVLAGLDD